MTKYIYDILTKISFSAHIIQMSYQEALRGDLLGWDAVIEACWGKPNVSSVLLEIDPQNPLHDSYISGILQNPTIDNTTRTGLADQMIAELFDGNKPMNEQRVGTFLRTCNSIFESEEESAEFKAHLYHRFTPGILENLKVVSARDRWQMANSEEALHAYCNFQNIEKAHPEEAKRLYETIIKEANLGRILDDLTKQAAIAIRSENRGTAIALLGMGAEIPQTVAKLAYRRTCKQFDALPVIAGYYRDDILTTHLGGDEADPNKDLMTPRETLAQIYRVEGSLRDGRELALSGTINNKGEITGFPGNANVGGQSTAAMGFANALRLAEIRRQGITYEKPEEADAYRRIKLDNTHGAVLVSTGDGAWWQTGAGMELAKRDNVPGIYFIQNNNVAIAENSAEYVAQSEHWRRGHGSDIPGIRIGLTEPDKLFLAMEFATTRALLDAGPTIVEAMTTRLEAHSIQHGDGITAQLKQNVIEVLSEFERRKSGLTAEIENYISETLAKASQSDNQLLLRQRLLALVSDESDVQLDDQARKQIQAIIDLIIDPLQRVQDDLLERGIITREQIAEWNNVEGKRLRDIWRNVEDGIPPDPKTAAFHQRMETPLVIEEGQDISISSSIPYIVAPASDDRIILKQSEAIREVLDRQMSANPNLLIQGTDVRKGIDVDRRGRRQLGGYFGQEDGLWDKYGKIPYRVGNTPIAEAEVAKYLLGMATTPSTQENLQKALRIFYDPMYADYGLEALPAFHILDFIHYATNGRIIRPLTMFMEAGAVAGGNPMHGHDPLLAVLTGTHPSVDVVYPIDPETSYKALNYILQYDFNPSIMMVNKRINFVPQEFRAGTGLMDPENGYKAFPGNKAQFIAVGAAVETVQKAIEKAGEKDVGLFAPVWLRPFPLKGLKKFLREADPNAPLIFVGEEPSGGMNALISDMITSDPELADLVKNRMPFIRRQAKVYPLPTEGKLMDEVLSNVDSITDLIRSLN